MKNITFLTVLFSKVISLFFQAWIFQFLFIKIRVDWAMVNNLDDSIFADQDVKVLYVSVKKTQAEIKVIECNQNLFCKIYDIRHCEISCFVVWEFFLDTHLMIVWKYPVFQPRDDFFCWFLDLKVVVIDKWTLESTIFN